MYKTTDTDCLPIWQISARYRYRLSVNHYNYLKSFLHDSLRCATLTDCNSSEGNSAVKGFAIVPYNQGIGEQIRRVLNNCVIKVALKSIRKLRHTFAKPKDRVPTDRKTHVVYSIPCGDCEKVCLGQTKRMSGSNKTSVLHTSEETSKGCF